MSVVAMIGGAFALLRIFNGFSSSECASWETTSPSMEEIISLKQRLTKYQTDLSPDAAMEVSGREVTTLLKDLSPYPVRLEVLGDVASLTVVVPDDQGCYNIQYRGGISVTDRTLRLRPEAVVIGSSDLSGWLAGREYRFSEAQLRTLGVSDAIVKQLHNVERLRLKEGSVNIRWYDAYVWW